MKLGEALQQRSDNLKRMSELQARLQKDAIVQEGTKPSEPVDALISEIGSLGDRTVLLIQRINRTNVRTFVTPGQSLADAIAERDHLGRMRAHYLAIAEAGTLVAGRTTRSEIKYLRTFDVGALRRNADDLAKARRELDMRIQQVNWEADLAE